MNEAVCISLHANALGKGMNLLVLLLLLADRCWGRPKGSLLNSYLSRLLHLRLIRTLQCWQWIRVVSSTIFLSLWYNSTWDWTLVSRTFDKHYHHYHSHHVAPLVRISQTLSCHPSLSSIASGRSSELHPVLAQSCCTEVRAGCPAFAHPCDGVHRSTSLMSLSLLL